MGANLIRYTNNQLRSKNVDIFDEWRVLLEFLAGYDNLKTIRPRNEDLTVVEKSVNCYCFRLDWPLYVHTFSPDSGQ